MLLTMLITYFIMWLYTPGIYLLTSAKLDTEFHSNDCGISAGRCSASLRTLHEYCGTVEPHGTEGILNSESLIKNLKLKYLTVIMRHGDETPPKPPSNATRVFHSNHWNKLSEDPFPYFHLLTALRSLTIEDQSLNRLNPLEKNSFFHPAVENRGITQLTKRGFMQVLYLGKYLRKAYNNFLSKIRNPVNIFARTTYYARTVQVFV